MLFLTVLLSAIALFKIKDLPKFSPTLGERLNKLTRSVGKGVASISPVEVRTMPFIAEGM